MHHPLDQAKRVVAALEAGQALNAADAAAYAQALRARIEAGDSLDRSLGFRTHGGAGDVKRVNARDQRDRAAREFYRRWLVDLKPSAAAAEMARLIDRFSNVRVRSADEMGRALQNLLTMEVSLPRSARALTRILEVQDPLWTS